MYCPIFAWNIFEDDLVGIEIQTKAITRVFYLINNCIQLYPNITSNHWKDSDVSVPRSVVSFVYQCMTNKHHLVKNWNELENFFVSQKENSWSVLNSILLRYLNVLIFAFDVNNNCARTIEFLVLFENLVNIIDIITIS